jgi:hypothetical protein
MSRQRLLAGAASTLSAIHDLSNGNVEIVSQFLVESRPGFALDDRHNQLFQFGVPLDLLKHLRDRLLLLQFVPRFSREERSFLHRTTVSIVPPQMIDKPSLQYGG